VFCRQLEGGALTHIGIQQKTARLIWKKRQRTVQQVDEFAAFERSRKVVPRCNLLNSAALQLIFQPDLLPILLIAGTGAQPT
jgi:hypothetical protein